MKYSAGEMCIRMNEINTFEDLYAQLICLEEKGIKGWHTDREDNDTFTIDGGESGRICVHNRKGGVRFEFLSEDQTIYKDSFSYKEAYEVCLNAILEWKVLPPSLWASGGKPDGSMPPALKMFLRIVGCTGGTFLVLVSAFMLFAIWFRYDRGTPFHVYLSLTFSFGVILLGGIGLILLSVRKKGRWANITEK